MQRSLEALRLQPLGRTTAVCFSMVLDFIQKRREQLIEIGRSLFASKGFEAVSVEEIAATAKVSKPIGET